jgi:hypothetical protein
VIATSVAYDLVFVVHLVAALATIAVLVALRLGASGVVDGADRAQLRQRFPDRVDWAARVVHLVVLSGLALSLGGDQDVSLTQPWVLTGLVCYLVLAGWLEGVALVRERQLAVALAGESAMPVEAAKRLASAVDVAIVVVAVALLAMVTQF